MSAESDAAAERAAAQYWARKAQQGRQLAAAEAQTARLDASAATRDEMQAERESQEKKRNLGMRMGAALVAALLAAPVADAQNIQMLEQMSRERAPLAAQQPAPPPRREPLLPAEKGLTCMSTDAWKPVYASPDPSSPVIGYTQPQVAVRRVSDGFAELRYYNGKIGYVPASSVRPFASTVKPGAKCSLSGQRANHSPIFSIG